MNRTPKLPTTRLGPRALSRAAYGFGQIVEDGQGGYALAYSGDADLFIVPDGDGGYTTAEAADPEDGLRIYTDGARVVTR